MTTSQYTAQSQEVRDVLLAWATAELAPWLFSRPDRSDYLAEVARINRSNDYMFLFRIKAGQVSVVPKAGGSAKFATRLQLYTDLLSSAASVSALRDKDFFLPMCLNDSSYEGATVPVFSFQKPAASACVLLPDVDFMGWNFYENDDIVDSSDFQAKKDFASFVGATTGGYITHKTVDEMVLPRLRAARYFSGSPRVKFALADVVQCESEAVANRLRQAGFGAARVSWSEQLENKFIISMDGNGATCSRVVIALKSNAALLKYSSDSCLYYFRGLVSWLHYIPIRDDSDVDKVVRKEQETPGFFEYVARCGAHFAGKFLNRSAVQAYVQILLELYANSVPNFGDLDEDAAIF